MGFTDFSNNFKIAALSFSAGCVDSEAFLYAANSGSGNLASVQLRSTSSDTALSTFDYLWSETITSQAVKVFNFTVQSCTIDVSVTRVMGSSNFYDLNNLFDGETFLMIKAPAPPVVPDGAPHAPAMPPSTAAAISRPIVLLNFIFSVIAAIAYFGL